MKIFYLALFLIIVLAYPVFFCFMLALLLMVAFLVLLERNVLSLVQLRKSPNMVSIYGILQTVMDSIKLLKKKMFFLNTLQTFFFFFSPFLALFLSILNWFFVPFFFSLTVSKISILITLFISSILVYTVLWASWGSNNTYSLIGGIRAVAQMISYEVIFSFFLMGFVLWKSNFNWNSFNYFNFNGFFFFLMFFFFFLWWSILLSELNRAPFDLVESESELVSGFNVEYSGFSFTLLFLSEYINIFFMAYLTSLMFFFFFNIFFFFFVVMNVLIRSMMPRYKFSNLMMLTWKVYLPYIFFFFFSMFFFFLIL